MAVDWNSLPGHGGPFFDITVIVAVAGLVCFAGRTYTSFTYTKRFHLDYWLLLSALVICVTGQITFCVAVAFGLGAHEADLSPSDTVASLRTTWISQIFGLIAIVVGKLSIIEFLDQIRGRHHGRPWFLYFVGGSTVIVNLVVVLLPFFTCTPVEKLWDDRLPGDCHIRPFAQIYAYFQGSELPPPPGCDFSHAAFFFANVIFSLGHSAVTDVILALYPVHLIWGVQLPKRMKVGLCCLMGFGLLAAVCSTIKTIELRNLTETTDVTYFQSRLAFATMIEAWIVLIVGCIPSLRPLMKAVVNKLRGNSSTKQTLHIYTDQYDNYGKISNATRADDAVHSSRGDLAYGFYHPEVGITEPREVHKVGNTNSSDKEAISSGSGTIIKTTDIAIRYD